MKAVQIEFVRDRRWQWVWIATLACCVAAMALFAWHYLTWRHVATEQTAQIQALDFHLQKLRTPAPINVDPRRASSEKAARFLQMDMNKTFATLEHLDVAGAKLRNFAFESTSGIVKLEYELESLDRAATVTEVLNTGYERRPWRLENVSASNSNQTLGATAGILSAQQFRGVWTAQLHLL